MKLIIIVLRLLTEWCSFS